MSSPAERLRRRIRSRGPISFAEFMEEALYGRGGYYAREQPAIGRQGDFVTGSTFSPLFGRATARLLKRLDRHLGRVAEFLEAGYGGGQHLQAVLEAAPAASRRHLLAWDRIPRPLPHGIDRIDGLEELRPGALEGLIFSYELFDAQPVHRLVGAAEARLRELWVKVTADGGFEWAEGELSDPSLSALLASTGVDLEIGQIADLAPAWRPLYRSLAERLGRGLLVTCDYGYESDRLLDSRIRPHGTLACYRNQRVHRNPFVEVGSQDLTAHVDLSALREEGEKVGLQTVCLTRQARWLMACGVFEELQDAEQSTRLEAMTLLDPGGMGEEIRVLIQGREVEAGELFDLELLSAAAGPSAGGCKTP